MARKTTYSEKFRSGNMMYGPGCCANHLDVKEVRKRTGFRPLNGSERVPAYWWQQRADRRLSQAIQQHNDLNFG